jgi:hypothetical protein
MVFTAHTRRTFLAASAGAVASLVVPNCPGAVEADARPTPTGAVPGRVGRKGISPGTDSAPSQGEVVLLDGRVLVASHVTSQGINAGRSVLLSPDERGGWSILYAEF